jgi:recombinational DNA repair protein RecT
MAKKKPAAKTENAPATTQPRQLSPARQFRELTTNIATSLLSDWVGGAKAGEAVGRISAAMSASAAAARDPSDFHACTPQSVGQCIAIAALTDIMPGTGSAALAYLVPQRPRKGEPPALQFMFSHRGLNALARRTGQTMIAIPISHGDQLETDEDGGVRVISRDIDNPPTTEAELRGVIVVVKEITTGVTVCRGWVPAKLIAARKKMSSSASSPYSPWSKWPVEMGMKTAMHYAISRGWCVIDDAAASRSISEDQNQDLRKIAPPTPPPEIPGQSVSDQVLGQMASAPPREPSAQPSAPPQDEPPQMSAFGVLSSALQNCGTAEALTVIIEDANKRSSELSEDEANDLHATISEVSKRLK